MTGRTHDLAAFTALSYVVATQPIPQISLATGLVAVTANMLGGLAPDIDQSTAKFWGYIRGGSFFGRLITPLLGGHRYISHSILGVVVFGFAMDRLLKFISTTLIVNMDVVWWAFMIGFISHLVMDTFTKEGVPWFFPIPLRIGIPPLKFLRIKTGGIIEKTLIFPGLILLNLYIYYNYYHKVLDFLRNLV